jgi:uncharacterized protein YndB with AHSA1/START domain
VFEAITRPDRQPLLGPRERLGLETRLRWQHVRANETRSVELVGEVVESTPPSRLVITWAAASQADNPDAYSRVTFDIVPYQDMVRLTVTHDELEPGSGMDTGIRQGWPIVLSSLKSLLETGKDGCVCEAELESCRNGGGAPSAASAPHPVNRSICAHAHNWRTSCSIQSASRRR